MAIDVRVRPVAYLDGSTSFVWSLHDSRTNQRADVEGRTGQIILRDVQDMSDLQLELASLAGALSEWCQTDLHDYQSSNWKKLQTSIRRSR